jgi:hypothetical protein
MAGFGETAALRKGSECVKHHVFLKGNSWERFLVESEVKLQFAIGRGRQMKEGQLSKEKALR